MYVKNYCQIKLIKLNKYIAIVLLGIFAFPIFFHSLHVAWHHSKGINCYCTENKCSTSNEFSDNVIVKTSNSEEYCPICEYKFSVNNLPDISLFGNNVFKVDSYYKAIVINQFKPCIHSKKAPRAPPFFAM